MEYHFVFRQGSSLVGTKNIHSSEILDRAEALYDDFAPGHLHCAFGEVDGDNHGKHFRCQTDSNCNSEEERLKPVSISKAINKEYQGNHDEHELEKKPSEPVDTLVKARGGSMP